MVSCVSEGVFVVDGDDVHATSNANRARTATKRISLFTLLTPDSSKVTL